MEKWINNLENLYFFMIDVSTIVYTQSKCSMPLVYKLKINGIKQLKQGLKQKL